MAHTFWRGEHIVIERADGTADIYAWEPEGPYGHYTWLGDYASTDEAERYVREMEALPEFPEIKPVTEMPNLQSIFDRVWTKQQLRKAS